MKTYDIFLFDADGTLFDFDKAEANALKIMLERFGFIYTESALLKYREINEQLWKQLEQNKITKSELQPLRFSRFFDAIGIRSDPDDFNKNYLKELGKGTFLIDGALEICKNIISCGKKIYIVTNGILITQEARIEHSPIKEYISDYFVSEVIGFEKPHISYFEYVFSRIPKIGKDKILITGDSLSADVAGGNNAEIDSCWFNQFNKTNQTSAVPTYEIHSLNELNKFI